MRKRYGWLLLSVAFFLSVMGGGGRAVLAGDMIQKQIERIGSDAVSKATPADATPSDATSPDVNHSDATPPDVEPGKTVLLLDLPVEGCRTQAELVEQLLDDSRDRIVLSADIEWLDDATVTVSGEKEVEMGEYRILVDRECRFEVNGDVVFSGDGSRGALFEVRGNFAAGDGVKIRAEGEHAAALEIDGGIWNAGAVEIYAGGTGARAVRFTGSEEHAIGACRIVAEGDGSRGIESEGPLRIFLSSVSGEEAAAVSRSGELQAFGCSLSPEPEDGELIQVLAVPYNRLEENGICIAVGDSPEKLREEIEWHDTITWNFFSEQTKSLWRYEVPVEWSDIPEETPHPGTWIARCSPKEVPEWFPMELYSLKVPIHVVDPERPFIMDAEDAGSAAFLRFFAPIRDAEELRLEYSPDEKKTWRDTSELSDSFVLEGMASVEPLLPERDYWFRLIVRGGPMEGMSNEILFVGDQSKKANGGGDRDHGDREDQGETPPHGEIIPPPADPNPGDTTPGGSEPGDTGTDGTTPGGGAGSRPGNNHASSGGPKPGNAGTDGTTPGGGGPGSGPGTEDVTSGGAEPGDTGTVDTMPGNGGVGEAAGGAVLDRTKLANAAGGGAAWGGVKQENAAGGGLVSGGAELGAADDGGAPSGGVSPGNTAPDDTRSGGTSPENTEQDGTPSGRPNSDETGGGTFVRVLILCMILLGGGIYACWKKHRGKH